MIDAVARTGLLEQHRRLLDDDSAIAEWVAEARGYLSITDAAELRQRGFSKRQARVPALLIPIYDIAGDEPALYQARPDGPRRVAGKNGETGHVVTYETAAGPAIVLDAPRAIREQLGDPETPLWITEGALNVDAVVSAGGCGVALVGAWKAKRGSLLASLTDWDAVALTDRRVRLAFDSDVMEAEQANAALEQLVAFLRERGAHAKIAYLLPPDLPPGEGVRLAEYLAAGGTLVNLSANAEADLRSCPTAPVDVRPPSLAAQLVALAEGAELFHTPDGEAFATVPLNGHHETFALRSRTAALWLSRALYAKSGGTGSESALRDALSTLSARALFDGAEQRVFTRVAEHQDAIYLDFGDRAWRSIEVTASGWSITAAAPVRFRRSPHALPLSEPASRGSIDELRVLLNIADDDGWALLLGWLIGAVAPTGPYPLLALHGEQGSAKSTTARTLRGLIDPSRSPLRAMPRDERELMISATSNWCLAFDNLSRLDSWFSDALCRLSTGGGFGTRRLHTDDEEIIFEAQRPAILNGIEELPTRSDLLDRVILVELPRIKPETRSTEREYEAALEKARPAILGGLLDAMSVALRRRDETILERPPRMADFAQWATAAEPGLGLERGAFLEAYAGSRAAGDRVAVEASPIAEPLLELVAENPFEGTASDLLNELTGRADDRLTRHKAWPKNARSLSAHLKRLAPNLRALNVDIEQFNSGRGDGRRKVWRVAPAGSQLSATGVAPGSQTDGPESPVNPGVGSLGSQGSQNADYVGSGAER